MSLPRTLLSVLALLPYAGLAKEGACQIPDAALMLLRVPAEEGAAIVAKQRIPHFLVVNGYASEVPGVVGSVGCWLNSGMVLEIAGTSDAPCSRAMAEFQRTARVYAAKYNRQLLRLRRELGEHKCASL